MKRRILKFYDKMIIATLLSIFALIGCCRKIYSEKKANKTEQATDTIRINKKIPDREVIAMYGVRPTQEVK